MYMVILYLLLDYLQYLKEQRLPPQTFIPLQSVRIKAVSEKLRTLGGTAKLIFDVIEYPLILYINWISLFNTKACYYPEVGSQQ